jgi:hypothetical protein
LGALSCFLLAAHAGKLLGSAEGGRLRQATEFSQLASSCHLLLPELRLCVEPHAGRL